MNNRIKEIVDELWIGELAYDRTMEQYPLLEPDGFKIEEHEDDGIAEYYRAQLYDLACTTYMNRHLAEIPNYHTQQQAMNESVIKCAKRQLHALYPQYWGAEPYNIVDPDVEATYWELIETYAVGEAEAVRFEHSITLTVRFHTPLRGQYNSWEVPKLLETNKFTIQDYTVVDSWD
jgi:hypothetical protein